MWPRAEAHGNMQYDAEQRHNMAASMWPRAEAHGNYGTVTQDQLLHTLQCGRGPKPTEMRNARPSVAHGIGFNVAAGRSPRKS